jgi:hypothetical protein
MRARNLLVVAGILFSSIRGVAGTAHAQGEAPQTINTRLEVRMAGSNLGMTMKDIVAAADSPAWIGYEVAGVPGEHGDCCGNYQGRREWTSEWCLAFGKRARKWSWKPAEQK